MKVDSIIFKLIALFVIWRVFLFATAYISPQIIPDFGARFPYYQERLISSGMPHFIWSFGNFDGVHYLGIAKDNYEAQFTQVFFPLYPILIKIVDLAINNFLISGMLISNVAFLAASILFYKLIRQIYDEKIAAWSVVFLTIFPTSFYFGAIYTESIFLLMIISAFYLVEKKRIFLASIISAFASSTRLAGVFLTPALLVGKNKLKMITSLIAPLGFLAYVLYLKLEFNNPLYFLTAQSVFGQERSTTQVVLLPQVIYRYLKILATTNGLIFANAAFELISTVFAYLLLFWAFKLKLRPQWLLFSFLSITIPTLTGTLTSMPRYILVAFPIYVALAHIKNPAIKIFIAGIFLSLLFISTIFFTQGYWVA